LAAATSAAALLLLQTCMSRKLRTTTAAAAATAPTAAADTIDEDLVDSIVVPASDPSAAEVFYRINSSKQPSASVNQLLKQMRGSKLPLLLLWGDLDPWITPKRVCSAGSLHCCWC
jgi:hypothetical protein